MPKTVPEIPSEPAVLGPYSRGITTQSSLAQAYFDQGMRLVYAFNHAEAIRAFREARRILAANRLRGLVVWALEDNAQARRFYEVRGWTTDGARRDRDFGGETAVEVRYRYLG